MRFSREFKVGALAIVSLTILYMGFNFLKGVDFLSSSNKYYVIYDQIDGLTISNDVILNGFVVGRVSNMRLMPENKNKILVELDIDEDIILGAESVAVLKSSDVLGTKIIELIIENEIAERLPVGGTLNADTERGVASALLDTAEPIANDLGIMIKNLNQMLENNNNNITLTMSNLEQTSANLKRLIIENRVQMNQLLANYNQVALDLSKALREVPPVMIKTSQIADSLQALDLSGALAKTRQTLENLNSAFAKINEGNGSMASLLNNDSLYSNLNKAAENLDKLLIDIRENPGRYINFSVFGKK